MFERGSGDNLQGGVKGGVSRQCHAEAVPSSERCLQPLPLRQRLHMTKKKIYRGWLLRQKTGLQIRKNARANKATLARAEHSQKPPKAYPARPKKLSTIAIAETQENTIESMHCDDRHCHTHAPCLLTLGGDITTTVELLIGFRSRYAELFEHINYRDCKVKPLGGNLLKGHNANNLSILVYQWTSAIAWIYSRSVWIRVVPIGADSLRSPPVFRTALTIPRVTVLASPLGLPSATTS